MKKLLRILQSSEMHWVGDGFPVRSVFSYNELGDQLSPFLLLDYAEPYQFPPGAEQRGVGAHPHKGFETVTIAYQGELAHRDSSGGGGTIGAGDVQWMTAGGGIIHEEFHSPEFTKRGGVLQMVQLWVNLPAKDKGAPAGYQTLAKDQIPTAPLPEGAGKVRVTAGEYDGNKGPARTFTPINLWDVEMAAGKSTNFPLPEGHTTAILVIEGKVSDAGGSELEEGDLAIYERSGAGVSIDATTNAKLLVMSGKPIDEPIAGYGPFVMNTQDEILQAMAEFRSGAMGHLH